MGPVRRAAVAAAAALAAIAVVAPARPTLAQKPAAARLRDLDSLARLKAAFNGDRGHIRIVLLLAPT